MEHSVSYYRAIQNATASPNHKQTLLWEAQREVKKSFKFPIEWESVLINGEAQDVQIIDTSDEAVRKIYARPNEVLRLGGMVNWRNAFWLITALNVDNQIRYQGKMSQCNLLLRWQDSSGAIVSAYATASDATKYGTGIDRTEAMQLGEFNIKAKVPLNTLTLTISRDQRFLIGQYSTENHPAAFVVSRINRVTGTFEYTSEDQQASSGYIEITLAEDQYRPDVDNAALGIADYKEVSNQTEGKEDGGWF